MQGTVSFHPIDLEFLRRGDPAPDAEGQKINPETYLQLAQRQTLSTSALAVVCHPIHGRASRLSLELYEPGPAAASPKTETFWEKRPLAAGTLRPSPRPRLSVLVAATTSSLTCTCGGDPIFITEGSAEHVSPSLLDRVRRAAKNVEDVRFMLVLDQLIQASTTS